MSTSSTTTPVFRSSALFGGWGGDDFNDFGAIPMDINRWPISSIRIRCGSRLDFIQVLYSSDTRLAPAHGGKGGDAFEWKVPAGHTITNVNVWSGNAIDAVQFGTSDGKSAVKWSPKYGGSGGTLHSVSVDGASLAYINGRNGTRIDALQLNFQLTNNITRDNYLPVGPWGGGGGRAFSDLPYLPPRLDLNPVYRVHIRCGHKVDSITFEYKDWKTGPTEHHGGDGGDSKFFELDTDREFISSVNLRSGAELDGIQFVTSAGRTSEWYGGGGGEPHNGITGMIAGIFGRSGKYIDQIGFFTLPAPQYEYTDFKFPNGLPPMDLAALKTIECVNHTDVAQTVSSQYSYQDTKSFTLTLTNSFTEGVKSSIKTTIASAEWSTEFSFSWTQTSSDATTNTETKTITESVNVTVPAGKSLKGVVQVRRARATAVAMTCQKWLVKPDDTREDRGRVSGTFTFDMLSSTVVEWDAPTDAPTQKVGDPPIEPLSVMEVK